MVVVAFAGNINAQPTQEPMVRLYDYEILWTVDWLDGDTAGTSGGKVAVDSNDNVFVYGKSGALDQHIILKYDADGNLMGEVLVDIDGLEYIESVNLEPYIEGTYTPIGEIPDTLTRIDDDTRFHIFSIAIDQDDNIILVCHYVAQFSPPQKHYVVVLKYNSYGDEIWKYAYDYNDLLNPGCDSIVSSDGSIFIPCMDFFWSYMLKLNPDGTVNWFEVVKLRPFWWTLSATFDSDENVIVSSVDCLMDPYGSTLLVDFTKFNGITGDKIDSSELTMLNRGTSFYDAALAVDTSDNSVFFGFMDYIYKIDASFNEIIWQKEYTIFINELAVIDEMLVTCGGWCYVGDVLNYYSAVYNKNSGVKLLDILLGPILFADDPYFQHYFNQMGGMVVDSQGDILQAGGEGGIKTIKFRVTNGIIPIMHMTPSIEVSEPLL